MARVVRKAVAANVLAVEALKPSASEYEISVREHRGLVVRVHPSGQRSFILRYRQDGILKRVALQATTLAAARAEWESQRATVREGQDPAEKAKAAKAVQQLARMDERTAPTISELATDFVRLHSKKHKRSWRADELMLTNLVIPKWGNVKAKEITRRDVLAILAEVAEKAPIRANRLLAVIRKMFNWAVSTDRLDLSPCAGVKAPAKEISRDRVLTDNELKTFWAVLPSSGLPEDSQIAFKLQLLTACRIGEIVGARWTEFDLSKGDWLIPAARTKNGRESLLPLSPDAIRIIEALPRSGDFLFPRTGKKISHLRTDVATHELGHGEFGIKTRFTSHDLRRTAATNLSSLGTSRVVMDAILNHKDRTVGAVYDRHDYYREKAAALNGWARHLSRIVTGHAPAKVVRIK